MVPACDIRNEWLAVAAAARCSRGWGGVGGREGCRGGERRMGVAAARWRRVCVVGWGGEGKGQGVGWRGR